MSNDQAVTNTRAKKIRAPWIAGGLIIVALCTAGAIYLYTVLTDSSPYLVVGSEPIERGQIIERADLGLVELSSDFLAQIELVAPSEEETILGSRALTTLEPGTLLSPGLVAEDVEIRDGYVLVGMTASVGVYPRPDISTGELMAIMDIPGTFGDSEFAEEVARSEIWSIQRGADSAGRILITLEIPEEDAATVAETIANNRAYLIQINENTPPLRISLEQVPEAFFEDFDDSPPLLDGVLAFQDDNVAVIVESNQGATLQEVEAFFGTVYVDTAQDGVDERTGDDIPAQFTPYLNN